MSSRNRFLNRKQRAQALKLYEALRIGRRTVLSGAARPQMVLDAMKRGLLVDRDIRLEYLEIADAKNLGKVVQLHNRRPHSTVIAGAIRIGNTRLIDNICI